MDHEPGYLIRYGVMGHVGKFRALQGSDLDLERGQAVVIQTDRGIELGEVLLRMPLPPSSAEPNSDSDEPYSEGSAGPAAGRIEITPRVIRPAGPDDVAKTLRSEDLRGERFALCSQILSEHGWPIELIDIELLLDLNTTVLHYLGAEDVNTSVLRARFRSRCAFDVMLEPAGASVIRREAEPVRVSAGGGCGSCGLPGGCGSGFESPAPSAATEEQGAEQSVAEGCKSAKHSACSTCGLAKRRLDRQYGQG
jgi:hypothetical protein